MYLTRITLSPTAFRARNLLASSQNLHAALAASFPVSQTRNKDGSPVERILWRLDSGKSMLEPVLYIVSPSGPDLDEATERITTEDRIVSKDYQPVLDRIATSDIYSFRVAANPTRYERLQTKVQTPTGHIATHRRTPLHKHDEQVSWLVSKLAEAGAAPLETSAASGGVDLVVDGETTDTFTRQGTKTNRRSGVSIKRVGFKGHLAVTDPDLFRVALSRGIGAAKGYGCGLVTIAAPVTIR